MRLQLRTIALIGITTAFSIASGALGLWQLERLSQKKAENEVARARLAEPAIGAAQLLSLSHEAIGRRAELEGHFDFAHELLLTGRSRGGSPGVNIVTPFLVPGSDSALLVNRGWVYSPDGRSVTSTDWRGDMADGDAGIKITGRVLAHSDGPMSGWVAATGSANSSGVLTLSEAIDLLPYPVADVMVLLQLGDAEVVPSAPVALPPPAFDDGPHLSYAIQWFAFALIAIVGCVALLRRSSLKGRLGTG